MGTDGFGLHNKSMTRQGLGHTGLSSLPRAAFAACLYLPHSRQAGFFTINPVLLQILCEEAAQLLGSNSCVVQLDPAVPGLTLQPSQACTP